MLLFSNYRKNSSVSLKFSLIPLQLDTCQSQMSSSRFFFSVLFLVDFCRDANIYFELQKVKDTSTEICYNSDSNYSGHFFLIHLLGPHNIFRTV